MAARPDAWDRRTAETDPAWAAFVAYRDMGLTRSLAKVARQLGKSKPLLTGWSSKHQWVARVSAYDADIDREWQAEVRDLRRKAAKRNATTAALAMQKVGQYVMQGMDLEQLKPAEAAQAAARLADVFHKVERAALGEPDRVDVAGAPGSSSSSIAGMSDEDRRARLMMLVREASGRLEDMGAPLNPVVVEADDPYAED